MKADPTRGKHPACMWSEAKDTNTLQHVEHTTLTARRGHLAGRRDGLGPVPLLVVRFGNHCRVLSRSSGNHFDHQGTMPQLSVTVPVDSATCTFSATLGISSVWGMIELSTMCGGAIITDYDSASFNFLLDTAYTSVSWACNGGNLDCLGIPNGPNVTGASCDDGNPNTVGDTWLPGCVCQGSIWNGCQAAFSIQQTSPWNITTTNQSTGVPVLTYNWWMPDGSQNTQFEPTFTFNASGVYAMCLSITDGGGCSSSTCDTIYVDSLGIVSNNIPWYDCMGILWGPNTPGSPCDDGDPNTLGDA